MNDPTCDFSEAQFETTGTDVWPSCFAVTDLAVASMGAAGAAAADLIEALNLGARPQVSIDRRLASLWFSRSIAPKGWELPPIWDAIAGDYEGADGWIRLHTNAPHHRAAALSVLNCAPDRETVSDAVRGWNVVALEQTVVSASGAAAVMRDRAAWLSHPQGSAVAGEPLVQWDTRDGSTDIWRPTRARPLAGLRVLDLTRVLAGPVATRVLAGFGADVLRVDPPGWEEPNVVPDVTLGKRCCRLDLKDESDLARFELLMQQAHILVHGYRPGALNDLVSAERRRDVAPDLIEVSLNAYGWSGPWSNRRGFDSLVQMSCGIAEAGQHWANSDKPHPLPVQALDHATGYFIAAAALTALARSVRGGGLCSARLSLARTAETLFSMHRSDGPAIEGVSAADLQVRTEQTQWGPAGRLRPAIEVAGAPLLWEKSAAALGSSAPAWP